MTQPLGFVFLRFIADFIARRVDLITASQRLQLLNEASASVLK